MRADQARRLQAVEQGLHPPIQIKGRGVKLAARHQTVVAGDRLGNIPERRAGVSGVSNRFAAVAALAVVLLLPPAAGQQVETDRFTGKTTMRSEKIKFPFGDSLKGSMTFVATTEVLAISIESVGPDWLFPDRARFLVDHFKRFELECERYDSDVVGHRYGATVYETIVCPISREQLETLAAAEELSIQVVGKRKAENSLFKKALAKIRSFAAASRGLGGG